MKVGCAPCADSSFHADGVHRDECLLQRAEGGGEGTRSRAAHVALTQLNNDRVLQGRDLVISDSTLCVMETAPTEHAKRKDQRIRPGESSERRRRGRLRRILAQSSGASGLGQGIRLGRLLEASVGSSSGEGRRGRDSKAIASCKEMLGRRQKVQGPRHRRRHI